MLEMLFTQGRLAFCKAICFPATEPTTGLCPDDNPNLNYPYKSYEDVLFALMEAWQCLLSEGFVAPRPANLRSTTGMSQNTTYFVTRRGKKIETLEDYEDYRKADLLRKHQLHPMYCHRKFRQLSNIRLCYNDNLFERSYPMAKRRRFTAKFKAEVVLEALLGESSQAELCRRYNLSENQISTWKHQQIRL